ncbi:hypothetical protein HPB52_008026 [Rhipicephalus sanguineus]|uniref:C3H1-type domain-containing protein n=1 Tax=Rhipicephalus sanguineus TaxID=34632 RepID=A0A9D4PYW5_RHISA|nr:hypothetical protein HPB52_008026 [Rhipicephalus sanguineus]
MATSKSANTYNRLNWEEAEFPILCQTCLGDNPYVRMTKERFGKECKICSRPFTVFRWCPGGRMRFKKTEVCQTCSKLKNVCQTCLLDLDYGLPVQVRDNALSLRDDMPKSDVNKEYYSQNMERAVADGDPSQPYGALAKAQSPSDLLMKLARTTPYYKRNRPHICSFWVKGECKRGEECPYRHEKPTDPDDPLADQNIRDRYYGVNDPVADKLLRRAAAMPKLEPPEDISINHAVLPSWPPTRRSTSSSWAAADSSSNGGRPLARQATPSGPEGTEGRPSGPPLEPVPGLPGALPLPPDELANNYFNLAPLHPPPVPFAPPPPPPAAFLAPPGETVLPPPLPPPPGLAPPGTVPPLPPVPHMRAPIHYPSQDPQRLGSRGKP